MNPKSHPQTRPQIIQPQDPSYRLIALTQGQVCKVDSADYDRLIQWNWSARYSPHTHSFYAIREEATGPRGRRTVMMHREIASIPIGILVDHRNHLTLDNRRFNLRPATHQQNSANRNKHRNNTSGFKGVSKWPNGKWRATIMKNGKHISLGMFFTAEEAHWAYMKAAVEINGEFAYAG